MSTNRFAPLTAELERVELEPGRFGQTGAGVAFSWFAMWGFDLVGLRFLPRLASPLLGWIVERLEVDGVEQLTDATPLLLVLLSLEHLPHVRPSQTLRLVVRLGTLDAAAAPVADIVATHAVLELTGPR